MQKSLLTEKQRLFLNFVDTSKFLYEKFYLTGGTALSEFYLRHRFSEDLDFFSEEEFEIKDIVVFLNSKKKFFGSPQIHFTQSFNRNIFELIFPEKSFLKLEFTYFPFKRIEKGKRLKNLEIDSLLDIAVNKIFTIYQNPRGRDFYDLYFIFQEKRDFSLKSIIQLARAKFDFSIDYIQLGTNLFKVKKFLDDPILEKKIEKDKVISFFNQKAKELKEEILK